MSHNFTMTRFVDIYELNQLISYIKIEGCIRLNMCRSCSKMVSGGQIGG